MSECVKYPSLIGQLGFITCVATGIGSAMVEAFTLQGAQVGFVDLDSATADTLASKLEVDTGRCAWFR
jgi:NAD(P)-dependent dehydrogenase (short-subunit alcohol dehydrogenase family)